MDSPSRSPLRQQIKDSLKSAMLTHDKCAVATLRLILAALKDRDIAARSKGEYDGIDDAGIHAMLHTMMKQRQESIAMYEQGGRLELAERERDEMRIIERFLPQQLSAEEIETAVCSVIEEVNAEGLKEMGKVMGALKARFSGQMDFAKANAIVRQRLA